MDRGRFGKMHVSCTWRKCHQGGQNDTARRAYPNSLPKPRDFILKSSIQKSAFVYTPSCVSDHKQRSGGGGGPPQAGGGSGQHKSTVMFNDPKAPVPVLSNLRQFRHTWGNVSRVASMAQPRGASLTLCPGLMSGPQMRPGTSSVSKASAKPCTTTAFWSQQAHALFAWFLP